MPRLEDILKKDKIVYIDSNGINDSQFNFDYFKKDFRTDFLNDKAGFGIIIEDNERNISELYGVFRYFEKKAQLLSPVNLSFELKNEELELTPKIINYLLTFFGKMSDIEPLEYEHTSIAEGPFKRVVITKKMPYKQWWKHMFIDLYMENDSLAEKFDEIYKTTKKVFTKKEEMKRYRLTHRYIQRIIQEIEKEGDKLEEKSFNKETGELTFFIKDHCMVEYKNLLNFLDWHSKFLKPYFFRNQEDYQYFLLAFYKNEFPIEGVHNYMISLFKKQYKIINDIPKINLEIERLTTKYIADINEIPQIKPKRILFNHKLKEEFLEDSYRQVNNYGDHMKTPAKISDDLWNLGFFVFRRNRKIQPTKKSYALIKIKGRLNSFQLNLFKSKSKEYISLNENT